MPAPNWINQLTDEQAIYAAMVMEKAEKMGVPPALAVSIALQESSFNPKKIGDSKEIGIMQVLPSTGEGLGYSPKDLADPEKNIEAGLKYLKQHLNTYSNAPEIAALAYNRGPGVANKFIEGESDKAGEEYVKNLFAKGAFVPVAAPEPAEQEAEPEPTPEQKAAMAQQRRERNEEMERQAAAALGGGLGTAYSLAAEGIPLVKGVAAKTLQALTSAAQAPGAQVPRQAAQAAQQAAQAASAASRTAGPVSGVVKYGINLYDLPEGIAKKALDMSKQPGGATDLATQRREALMEIAKRFPGEAYRETPGGWLLPADKEAEARAAMEEFKAEQAARQSAAQAAAQAARPASPLQRVTQTFQRMMASPAARVAGRVLTPLGLAGAGYEGVEAYQELQKPDPNYGRAVGAGLSALGGAISAYPPAAVVGIPLTAMGALTKAVSTRPPQPLESLGIPAP